MVLCSYIISKFKLDFIHEYIQQVKYISSFKNIIVLILQDFNNGHGVPTITGWFITPDLSHVRGNNTSQNFKITNSNGVGSDFW